MTLGSHQRCVGKSQVHLTPKWLIDALGPFDLDPCAATQRPWDCANINWNEEDDGLSRKWFGTVWLNPPFDRYQVGKWIQKLADHGDGIALVHARTEADWFRPIWKSAGLILFLDKRIKFCRPDGTVQPANSGAPVCSSYVRTSGSQPSDGEQYWRCRGRQSVLEGGGMSKGPQRKRWKPYSYRGIARVPCKRCGAPSSQQWQVCADFSSYRAICWPCDLEMNRMVLEFMRFRNADAMLAAYRKRMERAHPALAAGSRRAETPSAAQCEASQSGGEQPQRPTDGGSNVTRD